MRLQVEYWDSKGQIYNDNAKPLTPQKKHITYQIRHNPFLKTPDFYNIKPYDLLIEELKNGTP